MEKTTRKKRVSSGIHELDRIMGDLYIGDNVLWYEDSGNFSPVFCLSFIKETLNRKRPLIYVTFDRSPKNLVSFLGSQAESPDLTILDCFTNGKGNRSEVFNKFYEKDGALWPYKVIKVNDPYSPDQVGEAIYSLHGTLSGDVHFILDSLTGMQSLWGGEEQVVQFYGKTCPRLYELDTIAYWLVEKKAHSSKFKANINKIAQVAIDLSVRKGKSTLKIFKADKRSSKFLNEHHEYLCEGSEIIFENEGQLKPPFDLGAKIKSVRLMRGISQKNLAALTGVTPSTISQVEKGLIYPSIPALCRIADNLSVEVAALFEESGDRDNVCVFPVEGRVLISLAKNVRNNAEAELLIPPDRADNTEMMIIRFRPGGTFPGHFCTHKGAELGYLLSGQLEMIIENQSYIINPGETISLKKEIPGGWCNTSEQAAELLWLKFEK